MFILHSYELGDFSRIQPPIILLITQKSDHAIGKAVSRCPYKAEARVQSEVNTCLISSVNRGTGTDFSPSNLAFPVPYEIIRNFTFY
jgi:hypothetical protein